MTLIFGASGTLGLSLSKHLLGQGHHIFASYNTNVKALEPLKSYFQMQLQLKQCNFLDQKSIYDFMNAVLAFTYEFNQSIDHIIYCASISKNNLILKTLSDQLDMQLMIDIKVPLLIIKELLPLMLSQKGHIIFISSIVGLTGREGTSAYATAKGELIHLSRDLARELGVHQIKVNCILPGYFPSGMNQDLSIESIEKIKRDSVLSATGSLDEVNDFISWLIGTSHVSGQLFNLDSRLI